MGTPALPSSGSVYIDANVLIYRVEMIEPYLAASVPLWDALDANQQNVVTSELSPLEVLVKPLRLGDIVLESLFTGTLYGTPGLASLPITQSILRVSAQVRAEHWPENARFDSCCDGAGSRMHYVRHQRPCISPRSRPQPLVQELAQLYTRYNLDQQRAQTQREDEIALPYIVCSEMLV